MPNKIAPLPVSGGASSRSHASSASSNDDSSGSLTPSTGTHSPTPSFKFKRAPTLRRQLSRHARHASAILGGQEVTQRALFCLYPDHLIRKVAIILANHPYYTNFNLILIFANCIFLTVESGRSMGSTFGFGDSTSTLNTIDAMFCACFTLEMVVKIIAGGLYWAGPTSYLQSWWNRLDCVVVIFALLNFFPWMSNFTYVRALRLVRPLKAASNIPGLRVMMNAMLASTLTLGNVFLFVFLLLFTFALFGLQIYKDAFRNRCIPLSTGLMTFTNSYGFAGCSQSSFPIDWLGPTRCPSDQFCADSGINPYSDVMGYDNILKSWLLSLIVMSGEGWSDIMYMAEDAVSSASAIFFIVLTCLGNYLGGELVVAVMSVKFEDAKIAEQEKMRDEEEQKRAVREAEKRIRQFKRMQRKEAKKKKMGLKGKDGEAMKSEEAAFGLNNSSGLAKRVGDLQTAQVMQLAAVIKAQNKAKAAEKAALSKLKAGGGNNGEHSARLSTSGMPHPSGHQQLMGTFHGGSMTGAGAGLGASMRNQTFVSATQPSQMVLGANGTPPAMHQSLKKQHTIVSSRRNSTVATHALHAGANSNHPGTNTGGTMAPYKPLDSHLHSSVHQKSQSIISKQASSSALDSSELSSSAWTKNSSTIASRLNTTFHSAASKWSMHSELRIPQPIAKPTMGKWGSKWFTLRLLCHRAIFSPAAFWLYSLFTVLNCVILACDHWGISNPFKAFLDGSNIAFTTLFAIELIMRFIAIEWNYFTYGYFVLDFISVLLALLDTVFSGSVEALSALKAFRAFRLFTVFRHWKAMQKIMKQAHSSLEDLFYFSLVLFLFVFIFAQMGVQIAANRLNFPNPQGPARDNWDSIGWAMIVVFQVSTPENWNQVLYDFVQGVGWGGGVFIVITLLIGHYIIESLFVVVMFSHFGTDDDEDVNDGSLNSGRVAPIDHVQQMINRAQEHSMVDGELSNTPATGTRLMRDLTIHPGHAAWQQFDAHSPMHGHANSARAVHARTPTFGRRRSIVGPLVVDDNTNTSNLNININPASSTEETAGNRVLESRPGTAAPAFPLELDGIMNITTADTARVTQRTLSPRHGPILQPEPMVGNSSYTPYRAPSIIGRHSARNSVHNFNAPISPTSRSSGSAMIGMDGSDTHRRRPSLSTVPTSIPTVITNPTGFITQPISVNTKGFLGRIARNIERSKVKKAENDREREIEKLRQSRSASRRTSKIGSKSRHTGTALPSPMATPAGSRIGDTRESTRASLSLAESADHSRVSMVNERKDKASIDEEKKSVDLTTSNAVTTITTGPLATFQLGHHPSSGLSISSMQSFSRASPSPQMSPKNNYVSDQPPAKPVEEQKSNVSEDAGNAVEVFHATSPSHDSGNTTDNPPSMDTVPAPPAISETVANATGVTVLTLPLPMHTEDSQYAAADNSPSACPPPPDGVLASQSSSSPLQQEPHSKLLTENRHHLPPIEHKHVPLAAPVPVINITNIELEGKSASVQSLLPPPVSDAPLTQATSPKFMERTLTLPLNTLPGSSTGLSPHSAMRALSPRNRGGKLSARRPAVQPPVYDGHVAKSRRRFVIAHHSPPSNPWYRQEMPEQFTDHSLYLFSPTSRIRLVLTRLIHSDAWSIGVLLLIFFSCVLLALDYPGLNKQSSEGQFIYYADIITTVLYIVEMLIRFIVFGAIVGPRASLKNGWNVMEFVIVLVSISSLIYPSVSGLKALRALRPLRILSRLPGAKIVVSSLGKSMLNISNVLVVSFILIFCLAIVAVELFKGKLQQCLSMPNGEPLPFNQDVCEQNGGIWTNPLWIGNYDDISAALLVLFELCTEENWPNIMYAAVDSNEPGLQPDMNHNQWVGLYFVVAIVILSLFIKTLFTATILDGYSLNYAEITGAGGGTLPVQQLWLDFYKLAIDHPPPLSKPRPNQKWFHRYDLRIRRFFFDTAKSQAFEYFFLVVISLNVLALSLTFSYQPLWYTNMLSVVNSICTWLFVVEIVMLWLGQGVRAYFHSKFNIFDFVIVILTAYEFFWEQNLVSFHIGFNPSIFRVIRMVRIFKLFSKFPKLVQLGQTVWFSLPALYNVGLLMLLEYFIFSVLGMALFGKVKHGFYMTDHANYETFTSAMVTLFREMTGENWNGIMRDCMVQPPFCDDSAGECGSTVLSPLYHIMFQVMSAMLVMDLIVAIILNQFENQLAKEKRSGESLMCEDEIKMFGEHWAHFSHGKYTMPVSKLPGFLRYLPPPLGFTKSQQQLFGVGMAHYLDELKIPSDNQNVHYLDVIHQLAYRAFSITHPEVTKMENDEEETIRELIEELDEDEEELDEEPNGSGANSVVNTRTNTQHRTATHRSLNKTSSQSSLSMPLPYTTAGIRLANEDLQLITRQAQRQFPLFAKQHEWESFAGQVHRVIICQKLIRGVFDRKRLRERLVRPLLNQMEEAERNAERADSQTGGKHATQNLTGLMIETDNSNSTSPTIATATIANGQRATLAGKDNHTSTSLRARRLHVASPSFSGSNKRSVIAEMISVRNLHAAQRSTSVSNLFGATNSSVQLTTPLLQREGSLDPGQSQSSSSPIGSINAPPAFLKTVSLPLASTKEERDEEEQRGIETVHEHGDVAYGNSDNRANEVSSNTNAINDSATASLL